MTTDFRALCAELADELHDFQWAVQEAGVGWACPDTESLIDRARAALAEPEPVGPPMFKPDEVHPFVVRHYTDDQRPSIKGNGFDGLEVGEDRQEAEEFIAWINARLFPSRSN